jgi:PAS domain S-box-containing protein
MNRVRLQGWSAIAFSIGGVLAATLLRLAIDPFLNDLSPFATYVATAILVFVVTGFGPALLEMVLGGVIGAFLFMTPRGSFTITASLALYLLNVGAMLLLFHWLREAKVAMRDQRELWRATLASIDKAVFSTDCDGRVAFLNGLAERLTARTDADAIGRPLAEVVPLAGAGGRDVADEALDCALRRSMVYSPDEVFELTVGGETNAVEVVASPIRAGGKTLGAVVVVNDASATVKAAHDLSEAKETAETANLAKDRFLAGLGHELRTPLTPVLLGISYLIDGGNAPADLLDTFEMIRRNVEKEARLIDDLLDVVQIRRGLLAGSPRLVNAHVLIREALTACRGELDDAGVKCLLELDARPHHIEADPARFRQAIAQLLKNAATFSHRGGVVVIRSRFEPDADHRRPGRLVVEMVDSGIGIEPEALKTIFDSFGQGQPVDSRRRVGLGLGLSICRAIVAGAGGTLDAESPGRGRGATFTIRLDALPSAEHAASGAAEQPFDAPMSRLRILIVEDDEMTRRAMARAVRSLGHEVTTADSVASAIADDDPPIDMLISDIGLPDGTGHDVLRRLRS